MPTKRRHVLGRARTTRRTGKAKRTRRSRYYR